MSLYTPTYFSPPPCEDFRPVEKFLEAVFNNNRLRHTFESKLSLLVDISPDQLIRFSISGEHLDKLTVLLSDVITYCEHLIGTTSYCYVELLIYALSNYEGIVNNLLIKIRHLEKQDQQSHVAVVHWCELFSCCYMREEHFPEHTTNDMQVPVAISVNVILKTAFEQLCDFTSSSLVNNHFPRQ